MIEKQRYQKITPADVDKIVKIYTGIFHKEVKIQTHHVGKIFGELAITKTPAIFKKLKKLK